MEKGKKYLTLEEAAKIMKYNPEYVRRLVSQRKIPSVRGGHHCKGEIGIRESVAREFQNSRSKAF